MQNVTGALSDIAKVAEHGRLGAFFDLRIKQLPVVVGSNCFDEVGDVRRIECSTMGGLLGLSLVIKSCVTPTAQFQTPIFSVE